MNASGGSSNEQSARKAIERAAKDWKAAKKKERAARNALAVLVVGAVKDGHLTENKVATLTDIPRMTIRKMLGKN